MPMNTQAIGELVGLSRLLASRQIQGALQQRRRAILAHAQPISARLTEYPPVHSAHEAEGQEDDHDEVDTGVHHSENTIGAADVEVRDCQAALSAEQGVRLKVQNSEGGKGSPLLNITIIGFEIFPLSDTHA